MDSKNNNNNRNKNSNNTNNQNKNNGNKNNILLNLICVFESEYIFGLCLFIAVWINLPRVCFISSV
jgi:hypothetical protein